MKMEFLSAHLGGGFKAPQVAGVDPAKKGEMGGYCKGKSLAECGRLFGEAMLKKVCASCPN